VAKIKVTQTGSPIRRTDDQRKTLIGLGLNKLHRTSELGQPRGPRHDPRGAAHGERGGVKEVTLSRLRERAG